MITDQNRSFFLNQLDGFAHNDGILTLATTNHPDRLDPAIVDRPSRFDRKYHFGLPALRARARTWRMWNGTLDAVDAHRGRRGAGPARGRTPTGSRSRT